MAINNPELGLIVPKICGSVIFGS